MPVAKEVSSHDYRCHIQQTKKMYYREKLSIRAISHRTGLARATIRKWLIANPIGEIRFQRTPAKKKIDSYEPWLLHALNTDANLPKYKQRTVLTLFKEIQHNTSFK